MRDFDHGAVYYRVIGEDSGYLYRTGELEEMTHGHGRLVADCARYEFDGPDLIGKWLSLGRRVRRLRVPPTATVERNRPFSQGGCYTFSASEVELLDIIDYSQLMLEIEAACDDAFISLHRIELPPGFRFPKKAWLISLSDVLAVEPLLFPRQLSILRLFDSAICVGRLPNIVDELTANNCLFEGITRLPDARGERQIERCVFRG